MTTMTVRLPSGRGGRRGTFWSNLMAVIEEGLNKAERYQALNRMSDADLAARGLKREELPRAVMFGRR